MLLLHPEQVEVGAMQPDRTEDHFHFLITQIRDTKTSTAHLPQQARSMFYSHLVTVQLYPPTPLSWVNMGITNHAPGDGGLSNASRTLLTGSETGDAFVFPSCIFFFQLASCSGIFFHLRKPRWACLSLLPQTCSNESGTHRVFFTPQPNSMPKRHSLTTAPAEQSPSISELRNEALSSRKRSLFWTCC